MVDYILMNGSYDDFEYITAHYLESDPAYQESIRKTAIDEEDRRKIQECVLKEIVREEMNPAGYSRPSKEESNYQLQFGDTPVVLPVKKTLLSTLQVLGALLFDLLGESSTEKKLAVVGVAVYNLIKKVKGSIATIDKNNYCIYMFCQKCANENGGIIRMKDLVQEFEVGLKCRGWQIYPDKKNERCKYLNDDETCKLKQKDKTEEKIKESLAFFEEHDLIEIIGEGKYRLAV